jgi:hypothetical protein
MLALVLVLCSGAAMAQRSNPPAAVAHPAAAPPAPPAADVPPTVGDKPLVQVKPKKEAAATAHLSIAKRLQACLEIDDGTKGRLDCYDAVFSPKPNPKAPAAKGVGDCRTKKEEDERLACYNGFATSIPKF